MDINGILRCRGRLENAGIPIFDWANRKRMKILGLTWSVEDDNLSVVYHNNNNPGFRHQFNVAKPYKHN